MERLQKIIASRGLCSRRQAEEMIAGGRVRVNGMGDLEKLERYLKDYK